MDEFGFDRIVTDVEHDSIKFGGAANVDDGIELIELRKDIVERE